MNVVSGPCPTILREAAELFVLVRTSPADSPVHAECLTWIEANPEHRAAFAEIQKAWDAAGQISSKPWPRARELMQESARRPRKRTVWALAATVLLAAGLFMFLREEGGVQFATDRGEQQLALLPDGSRVELGGDTSIAVNFTPHQRLIVAAEGEAFYKVAPDPSRPFVVQTGQVRITALGTAFSVRREGEAVSVLVTEGLVEVTHAAASEGDTGVRARAGERVRVDRGVPALAVEPVGADLSGPWRRGRLRFEDEPLRVVVASLNRYSREEIVLADPALEELRFTGTVFDDRVEDWLRGVEVIFPVEVHDEGRRVRIEPR